MQISSATDHYCQFPYKIEELGTSCIATPKPSSIRNDHFQAQRGKGGLEMTQLGSSARAHDQRGGPKTDRAIHTLIHNIKI